MKNKWHLNTDPEFLINNFIQVLLIASATRDSREMESLVLILMSALIRPAAKTVSAPTWLAASNVLVTQDSAVMTARLAQI